MWILFVFHLARNRSAAKKFWLRLQFCRLLQFRTFSCHTCKCPLISWVCWLMVGVLWTINYYDFPLFCGSKVSLGIQQKLKSPLNKVLYREAPFCIPLNCFKCTVLKSQNQTVYSALFKATQCTCRPFFGFIPTEMTVFPTLSYTSTSEIPTLSDTRRLKINGTSFGWIATPYRPFQGVHLGFKLALNFDQQYVQLKQVK